MPNWKKLVVSGSDALLNSLTVSNGITGSLAGTASFATSASYALTASYANNLGLNLTTNFIPFASSFNVLDDISTTKDNIDITKCFDVNIECKNSDNLLTILNFYNLEQLLLQTFVPTTFLLLYCILYTSVGTV